MAYRQKPGAIAPTHGLWERPEPVKRPVPGPLSRDRIVRAAIAIADKEGLGGVSLRKVAAKLKAGPMRLYAYTSTKEGLLELMVDEIFGEMVAAGPIRGDWFVELLGGRIHLGPNALAYMEASLASLSGKRGFEGIDAVLQAVETLNAYVIGAIHGEASELRAELESGMNEREWQGATWPYLQRMISTGRFPMIARVVDEAKHPSFDAAFDRGLDCVIAGIEACLTH